MSELKRTDSKVVYTLGNTNIYYIPCLNNCKLGYIDGIAYHLKDERIEELKN